MKRFIIIVVVLAIIVGIYFAVAGDDSQQVTGPVKGNLALSITDAAADMGNVESITITVDEARLKGEGEQWSEVSIDNKSFDLLELKAQNKLALLGSANVATGTYSRVHLGVSDISVATTDDGEQDARIPSETLKLDGEVVVAEEGVTNVTLDFIADKSLHVTGEGEYIFAPVVEMKVHSGAEEVSTDEEGSVQVKGGATSTTKTVSMGADGRVKAGLQIPEEAAVEVMKDGTLKVTPPVGGKGKRAEASLNRGQGRGNAPVEARADGGRGNADAAAEVQSGAGSSGQSTSSDAQADADAEADAEIESEQGGASAEGEVQGEAGVQY